MLSLVILIIEFFQNISHGVVLIKGSTSKNMAALYISSLSLKKTVTTVNYSI